MTLEEIRLQTAKSISNILNKDFYIFNENLDSDKYRVTWRSDKNDKCITCEVDNISHKKSPVKTTIYANTYEGE